MGKKLRLQDVHNIWPIACSSKRGCALIFNLTPYSHCCILRLREICHNQFAQLVGISDKWDLELNINKQYVAEVQNEPF